MKNAAAAAANNGNRVNIDRSTGHTSITITRPAEIRYISAGKGGKGRTSANVDHRQFVGHLNTPREKVRRRRMIRWFRLNGLGLLDAAAAAATCIGLHVDAEQLRQSRSTRALTQATHFGTGFRIFERSIVEVFAATMHDSWKPA